jgi:hypothetical protein
MNSSILADIEETLSDETTREISCKHWYWYEFLPKIDEDNIRNDYRLVYQSFTINEFMYLPYDITDERWDWLINNQIVVKDNFSFESASNLEKWLYENMHSTSYTDNIVKYVFSDKFFEDYQRNVRERRKLTAMETWMDYLGNSPHRLYRQDKTTTDFKKYAWPLTYQPIL